MPLLMRRRRLAEAETEARALLEDSGRSHKLGELSGGRRQRADEDTAARVFELNRELGTTLLVVTHDPSVCSRIQRVLRLDHGRLEPLGVDGRLTGCPMTAPWLRR